METSATITGSARGALSSMPLQKKSDIAYLGSYKFDMLV